MPEFASVGVKDVKRTEVNLKLPIAKSVRELLNQNLFHSEIDDMLALISQFQKFPDKTALKASSAGDRQLSNVWYDLRGCLTFPLGLKLASFKPRTFTKLKLQSCYEEFIAVLAGRLPMAS